MKQGTKLAVGIKEDIVDFKRTLLDWELRGLFLFATIIIAIGVVFYMVVEGWDLITSLYFCVSTLTTVGYGDVHPTSDISRLFTTVYVLIGVGFILGFVNVVARQVNKPVVARLTQFDHERHTRREEEHKNEQ
ncbi:MAG TPA: potassium channel family protein [Candidatus Saccharimonadales bacterium]